MIVIIIAYEARTLLRLGCPGYGQALVFDTDTTPTPIIILNYVIFSNYCRCRHVGVRVRVRAS
jgi:hypothetical protein